MSENNNLQEDVCDVIYAVPDKRKSEQSNERENEFPNATRLENESTRTTDNNDSLYSYAELPNTKRLLDTSSDGLYAQVGERKEDDDVLEGSDDTFPESEEYAQIDKNRRRAGRSMSVLKTDDDTYAMMPDEDIPDTLYSSIVTRADHVVSDDVIPTGHVVVDDTSVKMEDETRQVVKSSDEKLDGRAKRVDLNVESRVVASSTDEPVIRRFPVRYLGSVLMEEMDLSPEQCGTGVRTCIVFIAQSTVKSKGNAKPAKTGDSRLKQVNYFPLETDLLLVLKQKHLNLIQINNDVIVNSQPLHTIRVWGIGNEKQRCAQEFAYVSRHPSGRKYACHVFHCIKDESRDLAFSLRDECLKRRDENIKRSAQRPLQDPAGYGVSNSSLLNQQQSTGKSADSHPSIVKCLYIGHIRATRPTGMESLNDAIDGMLCIPKTDWLLVDVDVRSNGIIVTDAANAKKTITVCPVERLTYLGVSDKYPRVGAFLQLQESTFIAHVFHIEPSAEHWFNLIESECQLHPPKCKLRATGNASNQKATITSKLKNMFGGSKGYSLKS